MNRTPGKHYPPFSAADEPDEWVYSSKARIMCESCGEYVYIRRRRESLGPFAFPPNCPFCDAEIREARQVTGRSRHDGETQSLEAERDHYRDLVEKVGVVKALRDLVAAADPLCGKLEVVPGRVKLPPEYYPAASPSIQALREAVAAAKAVLNDA